MIYSQRHENMYAAMVSEMLKYGGFQDGVNQRLRAMGDDLTPADARSVDDLYDIYGDRSVLE